MICLSFLCLLAHNPTRQMVWHPAKRSSQTKRKYVHNGLKNGEIKSEFDFYLFEKRMNYRCPEKTNIVCL